MPDYPGMPDTFPKGYPWAYQWRRPEQFVTQSGVFMLVDTVGAWDSPGPYHIRLECEAAGYGEVRLYHFDAEETALTFGVAGLNYSGYSHQTPKPVELKRHSEIQVQARATRMDRYPVTYPHELALGIEMRLIFEPFEPTGVGPPPGPPPRTRWQRLLDDG